MNRISAISLGLLCAAAGFAQEGQLAAGGGPSWKGLEIWFQTKIEPPGTTLPGGVLVGQGRVHHGITDSSHKRSFGYDIVLDPAEDGQSARIRIERWNPQGSKITFERGWSFLELPDYPVIPNVKVGDTVALDLLVNAATGQRVVDYLTLRRQGDMNLQRPARDFQLTDVELTLMEPRISVNGKPGPSMGGGGFAGAVVWLYLAGRGRFVLSLLPHEKLGFQKNGIVSENGLLFRDGQDEVRVECRRRVAPGSGNYNLYVLHQRDWPPGVARELMIGSADDPESVLGKK